MSKHIITIFTVIAHYYDHETSRAVRSFSTRPEADAFCEQCEREALQFGYCAHYTVSGNSLES